MKLTKYKVHPRSKCKLSCYLHNWSWYHQNGKCDYVNNLINIHFEWSLYYGECIYYINLYVALST